MVGQVANGQTVLVPENDVETLVNLNVDVDGEDNTVVLNTNLNQLTEGAVFIDPDSDQVFEVQQSNLGRPFLVHAGDVSQVSLALNYTNLVK